VLETRRQRQDVTEVEEQVRDNRVGGLCEVEAFVKLILECLPHGIQSAWLVLRGWWICRKISVAEIDAQHGPVLEPSRIGVPRLLGIENQDVEPFGPVVGFGVQLDAALDPAPCLRIVSRQLVGGAQVGSDDILPGLLFFDRFEDRDRRLRLSRVNQERRAVRTYFEIVARPVSHIEFLPGCFPVLERFRRLETLDISSRRGFADLDAISLQICAIEPEARFAAGRNRSQKSTGDAPESARCGAPEKAPCNSSSLPHEASGCQARASLQGRWSAQLFRLAGRTLDHPHWCFAGGPTCRHRQVMSFG
jgi:hypothetical protein